jgi:hypothetical protein
MAEPTHANPTNSFHVQQKDRGHGRRLSVTVLDGSSQRSTEAGAPRL